MDQAGSIHISQRALSDTNGTRHGLPAIIMEDLADALENAIRFSGWLLDRVDPVRRLTDVVPAARITNASDAAWRTRAEHAANPNTATITTSDNAPTATLTPARRHRQALTHDAGRIAEDLTALLRRQANQ